MNRFSSRRQRLDHAYLARILAGAKAYRRIAGYFRSSIFDLVGEQIAGIGKVQIVCNSELDAADVVVSRHVLGDLVNWVMERGNIRTAWQGVRRHACFR